MSLPDVENNADGAMSTQLYTDAVSHAWQYGIGIGSLTMIIILLVIFIVALYRNNVSLGQKLIEIVGNNISAMNSVTKAVEAAAQKSDEIKILITEAIHARQG